jgi:RimJ/RimL family protein N-acetyltransferase
MGHENSETRRQLITKAGRILDSSNENYLRFVDVDDAQFIYDLRSDVNISRYLSPGSPSVERQAEWLESYLNREALLQEFYFLIMHQGKAYGTVRLYDFRSTPERPRDAFCWGSWILTPDRPSGLAVYSSFISFSFGFDVLGFDSAFFDARKSNDRANSFYRHIGAELKREDDINYYYTFSKSSLIELGDRIEQQSSSK